MVDTFLFAVQGGEKVNDRILQQAMRWRDENATVTRLIQAEQLAPETLLEARSRY